MIPAGERGGAGPWCGREAELGALRALIGELRRGRSAALTVTGGPGAGRSRLLEVAVLEARAAGLRAAAARSSPLETDLPYGTAAQLVAVLCPPERLDRIGAAWADPGAALPLLRRWFLDLAAEGPLLLAIDDDQWTDAWSREWWQALARLLDRAPMLLVRAVRSATPDSSSGVEGAIPAPQSGIHLGPLSYADIAAALAGCDAEFAAAVREATAGNAAVFALALERFRAAGLEPASGTVPRLREMAAEAAAELAGRTLRGLGEEQLRLLRALTFGVFDAGAACALAGLHGAAADRALRDLADLGLVETGAAGGTRAERAGAVGGGGRSDAAAFAEEDSRAARIEVSGGGAGGGGLAGAAGPGAGTGPPRLTPAAAAAVLADMDPGEREELHARAAELGHRAAIDPAALAELLLGAPPLHRPWVVAVLAEAAEQHRRAGRNEQATALLHRALREPVAGPGRRRLLAELAAIEVPHAPAAGDRRLRQVLADAAGTGDTGLLVRAADLLVGRGDAETARRELAVLCRRRRHPALVALAWLADEECAPAPDLAGPALPGLPEEPAGPAQAGVLAWRLACAGHRPDRVRALAREALADREADSPLVPRLAACGALACRGDLAEAAAGLTAVLHDARHRGARATAARALAQRAAVAMQDDRWGAAEADLDATVAELPPEHWHPALLPHFLAARILVHLQQQRPEEAERVAAVQPPAGAERGMGFSRLLHALGALRLETGDPAAALGYFQECGRILRAKRWRNPAVLSWRLPAAIAQSRLGDAREAARLAGEELELAERWGVPAVLEPLRGISLSVVEKQAERGEVLSVPERTAAALAVRGLSNRDIAAELGVTVRTVELRLTKVYRKLGVAGRAQLPPELAEGS